MKYRMIIFALNFFRVGIGYVLCRNSGIWTFFMKDIDRNLFYRKPCGLGVRLAHKSYFVKLGFLLLFDDTFRNVGFYRLKNYNKGIAFLFKILFPKKSDCEIQSGGGYWSWFSDMSWSWNCDIS